MFIYYKVITMSSKSALFAREKPTERFIKERVHNNIELWRFAW